MISSEKSSLENSTYIEKEKENKKEFFKVNIPIKQAIAEVVVFHKEQKQKIVNEDIFPSNLIKSSKIYDIPEWKCSKALKQVGF